MYIRRRMSEGSGWDDGKVEAMDVTREEIWQESDTNGGSLASKKWSSNDWYSSYLAREGAVRTLLLVIGNTVEPVVIAGSEDDTACLPLRFYRRNTMWSFIFLCWGVPEYHWLIFYMGMLHLCWWCWDMYWMVFFSTTGLHHGYPSH